MIYYRQNLQYLINGGIPPIKPSIKYAYKISNFLNNINQNYNNIVTFENEIFNTITDDRGFMNKLKYMNNLENNSKFLTLDIILEELKISILKVKFPILFAMEKIISIVI